MRFFDTHLHLPRSTRDGVEQFGQVLADMPGFVGGLLVLNTQEEVAAVEENAELLPPGIVPIPYFDHQSAQSSPVSASGWCKVHPSLHELDIGALESLVVQLQNARPRGVMVHCFPWGTQLQYNVSVPYVIRLAQALPDALVLATHGGGYESWQLRAHAGGLRNVHFDFSMTLDYYEGSDVLRPLQRYLKYSPTRIHFGSDWPGGNILRQLAELQRLAEEVGIEPIELESMLLRNARTCWPEAFAPEFNENMDGLNDAANI